MLTMGQRIKEARKAKGFTLQRVADAFGINRSSVANWERDDTRPDMDKIHTLAKLLGVSGDYLINGISTPSIPKMEANVSNIKIRMIPVLSWVQAGSWTETMSVTKSDAIEWIAADSEIGEAGFGLIVRGDSMSPYYLEGDRIQVKPDIQMEDLHDGDLVVAVMNGDATFKRLVIDGKDRYLQALNKDWAGRQTIELTEACQIIGLVVGSYRPIVRRKSMA